LAGAAVDECLGIFLRQAARPFFESPLGKPGTFWVGILQRSTKLCAKATIEFVADGLRNAGARRRRSRQSPDF